MTRSRYIITLATFILILFGVQSKAQDHFTLQQALQTAKTNNPSLKTEHYNIHMAQSDILTAHLRPNPVFENESLQVMNSSHFYENSGWYRKYNRELFWQLSKPFQIAGLRKHKIEVAQKNVVLAERIYAETERELFAEVAGKWMEVWAAQKQLDIIQIAKDNVDSLVLTNQRRYESQVITQTALFRTELLAKQYALQYKMASQEVNNRQKEFSLLLGLEEEMGVDTADQFLFAIPEGIDSLIQQSLENRSDVGAAKSLIDVSESDIKLQKSLSYPQPELGVVWNAQHGVPHFGISFSVDLPVFDRNQGEIQKSHQLREQAEQHLFTIQKQIESEISVAFSSYQSQQQNIEDFEQLLQQSQIILDNVRNTYLLGGTTIIDFLEAQRSWLETQQQYYEAMEQYRVSYVQLLYASGLINQLAL